MIRRLFLLLVGSATFWLLVALPARMLGGGNAAVLYSGTALLLCLLPMAATLVWTEYALRQSPEQQLVAVLGGTGVRMAVVLGGAWLLFASVPFYREHAGFWIWVLVCYLFTLALEIVLMLAGRASPRGVQAKTVAADQPPPGP